MLLNKQAFVISVFVIFLLSSTSVLANSPHVYYDKSYILDGSILMKMQAGDTSSSTAEHKTLVEGRGSLERRDSLKIGRGYLDVITDSSWKAEDTLIGGLTVASTVKLNEEAVDGSNNGTRQVFAVLVKANPGEEGSLSQDMSAASEVYSDGDDNYFYIDQRAYTSGGTVKRYIDLTEPVTGEYLFEDSLIKGYIEITDSLRIADDDSDQLIFELGDGLFDDSSEQMAADESGEVEEEVYILYGEGMFQKEVLVGTPLEEVGLISTIDLVSDLATINDIPIQWSEDYLTAYDPEQVGSYLFEGELIFPDNVTAPGMVLIQYSVDVVELIESDHLEDAVHGGDNGEDQDPDKEADNQ